MCYKVLFNSFFGLDLYLEITIAKNNFAQTQFYQFGFGLATKQPTLGFTLKLNFIDDVCADDYAENTAHI